MNKDSLLVSIDGLLGGSPWPFGTDRLMDDDGEPRFDLAAWRAHIAALEGPLPPWPALLPVLDTQEPRFYHWGWRVCMAMAVLQQHARPEGDTAFHTEDLLIEGAQTVPGSMEIRGNLELDDSAELYITGDLTIEGGTLKITDGAKLCVLGNLTIDGGFEDLSEWCYVCVLGHVSVRDAVLTSGEFFVGGHLEAPIVHASYNHGHAILLGGVEAKIFFEQDHGPSRVWGPIEVDAIFCDEMHGFPEVEAEDTLEALQRLLIEPPEDEDEMYDWSDNLLGALEEGTPILSGLGRGPLFEEN